MEGNTPLRKSHSHCVRVRLEIRGGGLSSNKMQCQRARDHVKKQGMKSATTSPLAKSRYKGHSPPRMPYVAPLEVLLGKGLPLRSHASASRARGAYNLKRLGLHSPIIGFHYRSNQPRCHRTDRLPKICTLPRSCTSVSRARGAIS